MGNYIIKRFLSMLGVLLAVSIIVFLIMHLAPGDPASLSLGLYASPSEIAKLRVEMGLNEPLYTQYFNFIWNALHMDFGASYYTKQPVFSELLRLFPATAELTICAMLLALIFGILAGIISAYRQYSIFDNVSMIFALVGVSIPVFWLGLMLMWTFSLLLDLTPISGRIDMRIDIHQITKLYILDSILTWNITALKDSIKHLILPTITLATIPMAVIARFTRSSMLEVIRQDYIRTARAKGIREFIVIGKHALKNALIAVVTVVGLQIGMLLAGAVVTETVFSWPGIGRLIIESILRRDYPMVQGAILFIAFIYATINFIVDVSYCYLDPRVKYG
jgi:peptide/nickel transport system permease protein